MMRPISDFIYILHSVPTFLKFSLYMSGLLRSCLPVRLVYQYPLIGTFNDPVSHFAVPQNPVLWLCLYFSGFVCIVSRSKCN